MGALALHLKRFLRGTRATAAVEFALIVPIMLTMYFGGAEGASLLTVDRKVQSVAGAVGDLVAREATTTNRGNLLNFFRAATTIMSPYETTQLVQTVTAVTVSEDGVPTIAWSVRFANGVFSDQVAEYRRGDNYPLPAEMVAIAGGQMVIAAEASYAYRPLLGIVFPDTIALDRSNFFMPRSGETIRYN